MSKETKEKPRHKEVLREYENRHCSCGHVFQSQKEIWIHFGESSGSERVLEELEKIIRKKMNENVFPCCGGVWSDMLQVYTGHFNDCPRWIALSEISSEISQLKQAILSN